MGKGHAYSAARSMTKVGFEFFMGLLKDIAPEAHDKLEAVSHERWARYASRENVCWDQTTTNPSETANSMLLEVRRSRSNRATIPGDHSNSATPDVHFPGMCDGMQLTDC